MGLRVSPRRASWTDWADRARNQRAQSAGALYETVPLEDPVMPVRLVYPAQTDESRDGFVDPLSRGAYEAGKLLLGDREDELIGVAGQLQEPLRGAARHVEEHGVGQGVVGSP